jgi:hypothetical protein
VIDEMRIDFLVMSAIMKSYSTCSPEEAVSAARLAHEKLKNPARELLSLAGFFFIFRQLPVSHP